MLIYDNDNNDDISSSYDISYSNIHNSENDNSNIILKIIMLT